MTNIHTNNLIRLMEASGIHFEELNKGVKNLIVRGADVNVNLTDKLNTPLICQAVLKKNYDLVKLFLDSNANPNAQDRVGMSPLHFTSNIGSPKIASLLLEKGANIGIEDFAKRTPLKYYTDEHYLSDNYIDIDIEELGEILTAENNRYIENSLCLIDELRLSKDDEKEVIKSVDAILNNGADINYQDDHYNTAINYAVENKFYDLTLHLIKKGADLEAENKPLLQEIRNSQDKKMIELLIQKTSKEIMTDDYRERLIKIVKDETEFDRDYSKKDIDGVIKIIKETQYLERSMEIFNERKSRIKAIGKRNRIKGFNR